MKNTAALSWDLAAWEADTEQPGSEEITPVSSVHELRAEMISFYVGLVAHKQIFA